MIPPGPVVLFFHLLTCTSLTTMVRLYYANHFPGRRAPFFRVFLVSWAFISECMATINVVLFMIVRIHSLSVLI